MVNKAALMDVIWNAHPAYVLAYNGYEQAGLNDLLGTALSCFNKNVELAQPGKLMISFSPNAGTSYLNFEQKTTLC